MWVVNRSGHIFNREGHGHPEDLTLGRRPCRDFIALKKITISDLCERNRVLFGVVQTSSIEEITSIKETKK